MQQVEPGRLAEPFSEVEAHKADAISADMFATLLKHGCTTDIGLLAVAMLAITGITASRDDVQCRAASNWFAATIREKTEEALRARKGKPL